MCDFFLLQYQRFFYESIRHSSRSACYWSKVIQASFNSSDLQTSTVSFYALANVLFLRACDVSWDCSARFVNLYWCICLRYNLLRFDSNLRFPLDTARKPFLHWNLPFENLKRVATDDTTLLEYWLKWVCTCRPILYSNLKCFLFWFVTGKWK